MLRIAAILLAIAGAVSSNPGAGAEGAPTVPTIPNSIGDTDGKMANGQKNGDDTFFFGMIYGKGKYTFRNGDEYDGEWLFFMPHGEGIYKWADGDIYVGQWAEGTTHGKGKYTWADGREYIGDLLEGEKHGAGTFTSMWRLYRYQGGYSYGKKHGKGVEAWFWNFIEYEVEYDDGQLVDIYTRRYPLLLRFAPTDIAADIAGLILGVITLGVRGLFQPHFGLVHVLVCF